MLVFQTNNVGVELFSYVNAFFCSKGALWECASDKSTFQTFRIDITMEYFPEQQKLSNISLVFPVGKFRTDIRVPFLQTNL